MAKEDMPDVLKKMFTKGSVKKVMANKVTAIGRLAPRKRDRALRAAKHEGVSLNLSGLDNELQEAILARARQFQESDFVSNIWQRSGYWERFEENEERLGWLRLPDQMHGYIDRINGFIRVLDKRGIKNVVICGMGGCSQGIFTYHIL